MLQGANRREERARLREEKLLLEEITTDSQAQEATDQSAATAPTVRNEENAESAGNVRSAATERLEATETTEASAATERRGRVRTEVLEKTLDLQLHRPEET